MNMAKLKTKCKVVNVQVIMLHKLNYPIIHTRKRITNLLHKMQRRQMNADSYLLMKKRYKGILNHANPEVGFGCSIE